MYLADKKHACGIHFFWSIEKNRHIYSKAAKKHRFNKQTRPSEKKCRVENR